MSKFIWRGIEDEAAETELFGRTWQANVPQDASDVKSIEQMVAEPTLQADGTMRNVSRVIKVSEADILRNNPCFDEVGEAPKEHKKRGRPKKVLNAAEEHGSKLLTLS